MDVEMMKDGARKPQMKMNNGKNPSCKQATADR